jgi:hypothetical protein
MPQVRSSNAGRAANRRGMSKLTRAWTTQPRRIQVEMVKFSRRSYVWAIVSYGSVKNNERPLRGRDGRAYSYIATVKRTKSCLERTQIRPKGKLG